MLILKNVRVLDVNHEHDDGRYSIVIDGDTIREVTREPVSLPDAQTLDMGGRTVMPGMIDCHAHVIASVAHLGNNGRLPNTFAVLRAVPILQGMLNRGFTTVRDAGGADYALSTTGIAGPGGGTEEKPVGLVWFGLARKGGEVKTHQHNLSQVRDTFREMAAQIALDLVRRALLETA